MKPSPRVSAASCLEPAQRRFAFRGSPDPGQQPVYIVALLVEFSGETRDVLPQEPTVKFGMKPNATGMLSIGTGVMGAIADAASRVALTRRLSGCSLVFCSQWVMTTAEQGPKVQLP
jgi:hypothetical protein